MFALLGEPGRLRLLAALLTAGELCVRDLAAACGMGESAVSHGLRLLRARRVVSVNRRGGWRGGRVMTGRGHGGGAGDAHGIGQDADRRYLLTALGLLAAFMAAEVTVAVLSRSLVLLSDARHMLSDVGAIGAALWAMRLAARPARAAWTFGWKRAEVRAHLMRPGHARDVHDLHVWTLTTGLPTLSAHVAVDDSCLTDAHTPRLLDELQACLAGHFDVGHSTFQLEPASHAAHEPGTHA